MEGFDLAFRSVASRDEGEPGTLLVARRSIGAQSISSLVEGVFVLFGPLCSRPIAGNTAGVC